MLIGGPAAVYRTVVHVETFVELHYNEQSAPHRCTAAPLYLSHVLPLIVTPF
jgi:hypothetical protein